MFVEVFFLVLTKKLKPMNQYLIIAFDGHDENALERRMEVRPRHLAYMKAFKDNGNLIAGGAQLDDSGKMIGSASMMQFDAPSELEQYLKNEPYINEGIWVKHSITPLKIAVI
jgi:uncharacterized protein